MGSKAKKVVRSVAKKILPDKVEKGVYGPTEADKARAQKEAEKLELVAEDTGKEREAEETSRDERERASRRRARRMGRRQLLSYGRLGAPVEDEAQKRTLG